MSAAGRARTAVALACAALGAGVAWPPPAGLVYVLDGSLSMIVREDPPAGMDVGPTRFALAVRDLQDTLRRPPERGATAMPFRLVVFGPPGAPAEDGLWRWPEAVGAWGGSGGRSEAVTWLGRFLEPGGRRAPRGVSRLGVALEHAFASGGTHVLLYTDGVPFEPQTPAADAAPRDPADALDAGRERLLGQAREWAARTAGAHLDVVGVGARTADTREFLRALAEAGNGYVVSAGPAR